MKNSKFEKQKNLSDRARVIWSMSRPHSRSSMKERRDLWAEDLMRKLRRERLEKTPQRAQNTSS